MDFFVSGTLTRLLEHTLFAARLSELGKTRRSGGANEAVTSSQDQPKRLILDFPGLQPWVFSNHLRKHSDYFSKRWLVNMTPVEEPNTDPNPDGGEEPENKDDDEDEDH